MRQRTRKTTTATAARIFSRCCFEVCFLPRDVGLSLLSAAISWEKEPLPPFVLAVMIFLRPIIDIFDVVGISITAPCSLREESYRIVTRQMLCKMLFNSTCLFSATYYELFPLFIHHAFVGSAHKQAHSSHI